MLNIFKPYDGFSFKLILLGLSISGGVMIGTKANASTSYQIEQDRASFGWLNQYSLNEEQFGFIGPEACSPTSSTNGMTFMQNTYGRYFGSQLTGTTYQSWIATDETLIGSQYFDTNTAIGTFQDRIPYGLDKYIVGDKGFDLVTVTGMVPEMVWEFNPGEDPRVPAPLPRPGTIQDKTPTWQFIEESLRAGNPTIITMVYPDKSAGHTPLVTGFNWVDANNDGVIQKSEGATLEILDPLDSSQTYPNGQPGGDAKFTEVDVWNDPETGELLLNYVQYGGELPYEPENYALVQELDILAVFSIDMSRVKDYLRATQESGYYISQLPQYAVQNQMAINTQLMHQGYLGLQAPRQDGNWSSWVTAGGGQTVLAGQSSTPTSFGLGLQWDGLSDSVIGAAFMYQQAKPNWDDKGGYKIKDYSLSLYGAHQIDAWSLLGVASIATLNYDIDRRFALGQSTRTHEGSTHGYRLALGLRTSYAFETERLNHGPFAGLLMQQVTVDQFTETAKPGQQSTSLTFDKQTQNSTLLTLGWQASMAFENWMPYAELAYNYDFNPNASQLGVTSWAGSNFDVPTTPNRRSFASASVGVIGEVTKGLRVGLDVNVLQIDGSDSDVRAMLTLQVPFGS
mgnify:CR=1 FL=1